MRIFGKRAIDVDGTPDIASFQMPELRRWHSALGQRFVQTIDVLVTGHSIAEGYYAPSLPKRWIEIMARRSHGNFGPGGQGSGLYRPAIMGIGMASGWVDPWTRVGANAGTSDLSNLAIGIGRKFFSMNNVADSATYKFTGDRIWLLYATGPGVGGMSITIDGGAAINVDTYLAANGRSGVRWNSGLLAYAEHTVVVKPVVYGVSANTAVILEGAIHFNGEHDAGIRWWDGAHAGYSASHFTGNTQSTWAGALYNGSGGAGVPTIKPDLCIVQFGTNEYGNGVTPAQFKTDLGNHLSILGAVTPSIVLVVDWASGGNTVTPGTPRTDAGWQAYRDVVYQLAGERGCAVADEYVLGGFMNPDTYGFTQDTVHPNERGSLAIADYLCDILGIPKVTPRRYDTMITSTGTGTVNFTHGLGSYTPQVTVYRRLAGPYAAPLGVTGIRWTVVDKDTIQLDFDTYSRSAGEFSLTVTA